MYFLFSLRCFGKSRTFTFSTTAQVCILFQTFLFEISWVVFKTLYETIKMESSALLELVLSQISTTLPQKEFHVSKKAENFSEGRVSCPHCRNYESHQRYYFDVRLAHEEEYEQTFGKSVPLSLFWSECILGPTTVYRVNLRTVTSNQSVAFGALAQHGFFKTIVPKYAKFRISCLLEETEKLLSE
ncbi:hypothetical protein GMAR_ORF263 [Golden Marseillevirus]|uniref:hypothetical protein n=1 Tax=Golden Marseillevirus TaxID=1720526 RepID=UPI000877AB0D|nr:hypothetical protein GMAR_ORF263 [Golden Marseillevirus]ALX27637.1 hypothetical protein GMAR_ORF263 [Golden Marseillevirus]